MGAKEYYYSENNKINPRHDLPEGVIVLRENELFQLMDEYATKILHEGLIIKDYLTSKKNDTTGDTTVVS